MRSIISLALAFLAGVGVTYFALKPALPKPSQVEGAAVSKIKRSPESGKELRRKLATNIECPPQKTAENEMIFKSPDVSRQADPSDPVPEISEPEHETVYNQFSKEEIQEKLENDLRSIDEIAEFASIGAVDCNEKSCKFQLTAYPEHGEEVRNRLFKFFQDHPEYGNQFTSMDDENNLGGQLFSLAENIEDVDLSAKGPFDFSN